MAYCFNMELRWLCPVISLFIIHFLIPVLSQLNPIFDPRDNNAGVNTFYLTSKSDCGDELKNIYNYKAVVRGYDLKNIGTGPTSCTIKLTSSSVYEGVQLQINIISVDIRDCRTTLSIYDGQGTQLLGSYDCKTSDNPNRHRLTTGDTVKFTMNRPTGDAHNFNIEIQVKAIRTDSPDRPGVDYYDFQKFDQDAIVGMIGGFYALVLIICVSVVCYCNFRYRGLNKKWETHQLATMKTDTSFEAQSQVSQPPWSVGVPSHRGPTSHYSRSHTEQPYSRKGAAARSEDGSSVVYDHDEKFQQRNLMNNDRDRHRGRDRMASQNSVYTDEDDADNFKEKVITPRVKTTGKWRPKDQRPPSFEEATRERSPEGSSEEESDEETEESSDNNSTRKRLTTSSEEETSQSETGSESEESSLNSRRGAGARKTKHHKPKGKGKTRKRRDSLSDDASSQRTEPRRRQPQAVQPPPFQSGVPYGAYPPPGGQFVPVMAGPPPQFQPVQMVPPNYPPPHYPVELSHPPTSHSNVQPTDPPVYSYLVRRGYTPLDARNASNNSPAGSANSSQRNGPTQREEPDIPLQSGVEYMRR